MAKYNIFICDQSTKYAESLQKYLLTVQDNTFTVSIASSKESLYNGIESHSRKIDMLLITPELYDKDMDTSKISLTVILAEGRLPEHLSKLEYINKFQPGSSISEAIIKKYIKIHNEIDIEAERKKTKLIGVYSPTGGAGTSTIAAISSVLLAQSASVLYTNLEPFPSTEQYFRSSAIAEDSFSDFLHCINIKSKNIVNESKAFSTTDIKTNIDFFKPLKCFEEIGIIKSDSWKHFGSKMAHEGIYDYIVIDFNSALNASTISLLDCCAVIFMPFLNSNISFAKTSSFLKDMELLDQKSIVGKCKFILNKHKGEPLICEEQISVSCILPYDKNILSMAYDNFGTANPFSKELNKFLKMI